MKPIAQRGALRLVPQGDEHVALIDGDGAFLVLDKRDLLWLIVTAGPAGLRELRRAGVPEAGGGPASGDGEAIDPEDGRQLLATQIEPAPPAPPTRLA